MNSLTPKEISKWFREQASLFTQMADNLDKIYASAPVQILENNPKTITAEAIEELLEEKAMRVKTIAIHFGVPEWEVERIVSNPENRFAKGSQGWITMKWKSVAEQ